MRSLVMSVYCHIHSFSEKMYTRTSIGDLKIVILKMFLHHLLYIDNQKVNSMHERGYKSSAVSRGTSVGTGGLEFLDLLFT